MLKINGVEFSPDSPIMRLTIRDLAIINPKLKVGFEPLRQPCPFLMALWRRVAGKDA